MTTSLFPQNMNPGDFSLSFSEGEWTVDISSLDNVKGKFLTYMCSQKEKTEEIKRDDEAAEPMLARHKTTEGTVRVWHVRSGRQWTRILTMTSSRIDGTLNGRSYGAKCTWNYKCTKNPIGPDGKPWENTKTRVFQMSPMVYYSRTFGLWWVELFGVDSGWFWVWDPQLNENTPVPTLESLLRDAAETVLAAGGTVPEGALPGGTVQGENEQQGQTEQGDAEEEEDVEKEREEIADEKEGPKEAEEEEE